MAEPLGLLTKLLAELGRLLDAEYPRTEIGITRVLEDVKALKDRAEMAAEESGAIQK